MRFRGRSHRSLDPKGRLMLPPEFRDTLLSMDQGSRVVVTTYDNCLVGFPLPEWEELEEKFSRLQSSSRQIRNFRRLVIGGAEELTLDKQGRVRLSQDHRDYAGITKDIVLVGQVRTFEIWDQATFKTDVLNQDLDDEVAEELAQSGIGFFL